MTSENDIAVLNCIFNPLLPTSDIVYDEDLSNIIQDNEELTDETRRAKEKEVEGVKAAEEGNLSFALDIFNEAILIAPQRASGFNNRAQVYRLLDREEEALQDLNKAIELSQGEGRSGCQALCQRGLLYRKRGNTSGARVDFTKAADLGSKFAKQQLVEINPYAAMCNQMLHDVMTKLYDPQPPARHGA